MRYVYRLLILLMGIFFFLPIHLITAAPDKTTSILLNEPVSMMTYGISKLQSNLRSTFYDRDVFSGKDIYVGYVEESDRIFINVRAGWYSSKKDLITDCKSAINQIRNNAGVELETGRTSLDDGTVFSRYFWQWGRKRSTEFYLALDEKFYLNCDAFITNGGSHSVSGRLVSNEIILSK